MSLIWPPSLPPHPGDVLFEWPLTQVYICVYECAYVILTRVYLSVRVSNLIMIIALGALLLPLPFSALNIDPASFYSADIVPDTYVSKQEPKHAKTNEYS